MNVFALISVISFFILWNALGVYLAYKNKVSVMPSAVLLAFGAGALLGAFVVAFKYHSGG